MFYSFQTLVNPFLGGGTDINIRSIFPSFSVFQFKKNKTFSIDVGGKVLNLGNPSVKCSENLEAHI